MDSEKSNETIKKLNKYFDKKISEQIEKGIYDFSDDYSKSNDVDYLFESIYDTKLDEILEGLSNNDDLVKNLNNEKDLKYAYNFPFLDPEKINPSKYEKLLKKKEIEEYKKNDVKSSDVFKCSKCKKSKCQVEQKQTRAGDEPPTTFVKCLVCGNTFTFN